MDLSIPERAGRIGRARAGEPEGETVDEVLTDLSPPALARAIEANLSATWRSWGCSPHCELHDDGDLVRYVTGIPFPLCNGVFDARLAADADARIDETLAYFRERQLPLLWYVGPSNRPADLGARLAARGLHGGDTPGMAADLRALDEGQPTPAGLTIERVSDERMLRRFGQILCAGFGIPEFVGEAMTPIFIDLGLADDAPFRHYLASLDGGPVAAASAFLGAGVVGIYNVATLPQARRRGIGAAITLAPLREARALGYRVGVLGSSAEGYGVYRRLGFAEYCTLATYAWMP